METVTYTTPEMVEYEDKEYVLLEKFTASDVPDTMQNELSALADLGEREAWGTARRVQLLLDMLHAEGVHPYMMKLYAAIGVHARRSAETVRMYHSVYRAIPESVLQMYSTENGRELGFHQFKALVPVMRGRPAPEWVEKIEAWYLHCAEHHINQSSVDGIRAWIQGEAGAETPAIGRHRRVQLQVLKLAQDFSLPEPLRMEYVRHQDKIRQIVSQYGYVDWVID